MRITFIQTGDFREADLTISASGQETYHAQQHSMSVVYRLAERHEYVSVISTDANLPSYSETLKSGVVTHGFKLYEDGRKHSSDLRQLLEKDRPTHVVLRLPDPEILQMCLEMGAQVFPVFADTIGYRPGLRRIVDFFRTRKLASLLKSTDISFVGNHNLAASESLARIGIPRPKIVPWDWPRPFHPGDFPPKTYPAGECFRLLFVGVVSEGKGIIELLKALAILKDRDVELTIVGKGQIEQMREHAEELGVADRVSFSGQIPFGDVMDVMRKHDALVVFPRATYAEGMPGVLYQGLAARLPTILSPHPVFKFFFKDSPGLLMAPSFEPSALAEAVLSIITRPQVYEDLSQNSGTAFYRILRDTDWVELVERWISGTNEDTAWIKARTLDQISE